MIGERDTTVVRIPIDQITVVNPRSRGKHKFRQIVGNIAALGLKKPVTVVRRGDREGRPSYDLVCGQGRLEACRQLGETTVPALVISATREELLLMSLAENLARRRQTSVELLREIGVLKDRGHTYAEIARKTDLEVTYVKGIVRLLKQGETRLLRAVEKGEIPISIAVTIATADDQQVQRALAEAYENNSLRGKELFRARRIIEQRRAAAAKSAGGPATERRGELTATALMQAFKRETAKQRLLVHKAKVCEARLLFVETALRQLLGDPALVAVLEAEGLDKAPEALLQRMTRRAG